MTFRIRGLLQEDSTLDIKILIKYYIFDINKARY